MPWKQLLGIGDIIEQSAVVDGIDAADKRALLRRVADEACRYTGLCDFHVFEKLFERESLSSTATGGGVAIPVVRSAGVSEPRVMFFRLSQPVTMCRWIWCVWFYRRIRMGRIICVPSRG